MDDYSAVICSIIFCPASTAARQRSSRSCCCIIIRSTDRNDLHPRQFKTDGLIIIIIIIIMNKTPYETETKSAGRFNSTLLVVGGVFLGAASAAFFLTRGKVWSTSSGAIARTTREQEINSMGAEIATQVQKALSDDVHKFKTEIQRDFQTNVSGRLDQPFS